MKIKHKTIGLFPFVNGNLGCEGKPLEYPGDLKFILVKKKKNISLIRCKNAGFAWVNNVDVIQYKCDNDFMKNVKLYVFFGKIAAWQPKPYLCGDGRGEPLSKWFYRHKFNHPDSCVERNWFGNVWSDFFWWLSNKFI